MSLILLVFVLYQGLACKVVVKNRKKNIDLLSGIVVLLTIEGSIRGGICHSIYQYAKANNKDMKDFDKIKIGNIFNIGIQIIHMVGQCCKSFQ